MAAKNPDRVSLAKLAEDISKARKLEAQIAKLKAQLTPITAALKAAMGDATTGHINGKAVFTQAITTRETVDTKNLRLEQPEIAAKYLKTAVVRTYRLEPDFTDDLTVAFCHGAPAGFEADCGTAGAHGPHEIGGDPRPADPTAGFLRALAHALADGAPKIYALNLVNALGDHVSMQSYAPGKEALPAILEWARRIGAPTVRIKHRYSPNGDRFSAVGRLGGRQVEVWDVINHTGAEGTWVEDVPLAYLARSVQQDQIHAAAELEANRYGSYDVPIGR